MTAVEQSKKEGKMKALDMNQMEVVNGGWFWGKKKKDDSSSSNESPSSDSKPKEDKVIEVTPGTGDITVSCCNLGVVDIDIVSATLKGKTIFDSWSNAVLENAEAGHGLVSPAE